MNSFLVYKSSAGSGKTYTLVKEYLKMVLKRPDRFRNVLAITFTNKAANEMKSRILQNLKELSHPEAYAKKNTITALLPELSTALNLSPEQITQQAQEVLRLILHQYSDFAISTIDSFVQQVIRTFAFDLHVPVNYAVQLEVDEVIKNAIQLLLEDLGKDPLLTDLLINFSKGKIMDDKNWDIEKDLSDIAAILKDEDSVKKLKEIEHTTLADFIQAEKNIQTYLFTEKKYLQKIGTEITSLFEINNLNATDFYQGNKGIWKYFYHLRDGSMDKVLPNAFVQTSIREGKWTSSKTPRENEVLALTPLILEKFNQVMRWIENTYAKYMSLSVIKKTFSSFAVLKEINEKIQEIKGEESLLLITEANQTIAKVVESESIPFIYERLGVRYKHFLIDEFQDTSILQWQNLLPLFDNALSDGHTNLIVGDGKQAIYRFRNGEVEQFAQLPKVYQKADHPYMEEREQALIRHYEEKILNTNYRSKPAIIDFNNTLYTVLKKLLPENLQHIYLKHEQSSAPDATGGYVQIRFIEEKGGKEAYFTKTTELITATIEDLLSTQNYQYRDIAILCRNNKDAAALAALLMEKQYPVISQESLLLSYSPAIHLVISMLEHLSDRENPVFQLAVIKSLYQIGKIDAGRFRQFFNTYTKGSFEEALQSFGFDFHPVLYMQLPLYTLVGKILRLFDLHQTEDAYLQYFLDFTWEFVAQEHADIKAFLTYWEEKKHKVSILLPEGINAIQIQTIHKSKGLQFPVVIYPFADEKIKPSKDKFWAEQNHDELVNITSVLIPNVKDLEHTVFSNLRKKEAEKSFLDLLNVLYVATTRPVERLYIFGEQPAKAPENIDSVNKMLYYFLEQMQVKERDEQIFEFGAL